MKALPSLILFKLDETEIEPFAPAMNDTSLNVRVTLVVPFPESDEGDFPMTAPPTPI